MMRWIRRWLLVYRENRELRDLILHCWVHSGYPDCGYREMEGDQRALYCRVTGTDKRERDVRLVKTGR